MEDRSYRRAFVLATLGAVVALLSQSAQAQGPAAKILDPTKRDTLATFEKTLSEKRAELSSAEIKVGIAPETGNVPLAAKSGEAKSKNAIPRLRLASARWHLDLEESTEQPQSNTGGAGQQAQTDAEEAHELAKKLSNPIASLISVPFQSNFDFHMGTGSGWRYTLNFQPVIPVALNKKWNLISRTILPIIHQGNVTGPRTSQSGLGDVVQSFFFSPNKTKPFIWGVGPVALIPTATNDALGNKQLGLGPTIVVLKQEHGWTYGALANQIWRVAGGSGRARVNATFLQPFVTYTTKDAWTYSVNTESTYDWTGNHWAVPIHVQVAKLVRFGKHPVQFAGALRCWATSPSGGPEGCGFRMAVTPLFPKK